MDLGIFKYFKNQNLNICTIQVKNGTAHVYYITMYILVYILRYKPLEKTIKVLKKNIEKKIHWSFQKHSHSLCLESTSSNNKITKKLI